MLYIFALAWGTVGGGFAATWPGYAPAMIRNNLSAYIDVSLVLALMAAGRGVGVVIAGPSSERLLDLGWKSQASFAYGTSYGSLIVFTGVATAFSEVACIERLLRII